MLIEFSVTNFRSFRERQTFSMVATPRLRKKNCVFDVDVDGERLPSLLKMAAIYGPNASGKSNLLKALTVIRRLANKTPTSENITLPVAPFRFDSSLTDQPSVFEIHFVEQRCRYQFEVSVTASRIHEERLVAYPGGKETLLYERRYNGEIDEYKIGPALEGGDQLHDAWRNLTGPQSLFIAQAVANSSEGLKQLRKPFRWLQKGFTSFEGEMDEWIKGVQFLGASDPKTAFAIAKYLRSIDVPVADITFEGTDKDGLPFRAEDGQLKSVDDYKRFRKSYRFKTTLVHETNLGKAEFDLSEESEGTRNLLGFFLPWSVKQTQIVLVDEFDSSLHPKLVAALVAKHLEGSTASQLIFTTHDTHLMDTKLLRRDQIWLTERDAAGATQLRSVYDFEGREGEDVEKRYYEGRYRALPILAQA